MCNGSFPGNAQRGPVIVETSLYSGPSNVPFSPTLLQPTVEAQKLETQ